MTTPGSYDLERDADFELTAYQQSCLAYFESISLCRGGKSLTSAAIAVYTALEGNLPWWEAQLRSASLKLGPNGQCLLAGSR